MSTFLKYSLITEVSFFLLLHPLLKLHVNDNTLLNLMSDWVNLKMNISIMNQPLLILNFHQSLSGFTEIFDKGGINSAEIP